MLFLFRWLTWKENRGASLSLALLASLAQYRRTSNDCLPVICVSREAARALFLCSTVNEVVWVFGRKDGRFQVQPLDGGATPDSKPPSLDDEEENHNCTHNESYIYLTLIDNACETDSNKTRHVFCCKYQLQNSNTTLHNVLTLARRSV